MAETTGQSIYGKLKFVRGLFGLSENGFRLYEKAGLVHTVRNDENGYRMVPIESQVLLRNAYNLTHLGLTLKEASDLLTGATCSEHLAKYQELDERLNSEMMELTRRKAYLSHKMRILELAVREPCFCELVDGPSADGLCEEVFFLPWAHLDMTPVEGTYEDSVAWWRASPFVDEGMVPIADEDGTVVDAIYGSVCSRRDAGALELPISHAESYGAPGGGLYVHSFAAFPVDTLPNKMTYAHVARFMRDNGLEPTGARVLHRLIRHQVVDGGLALRHDELFLPVRCVDPSLLPDKSKPRRPVPRPKPCWTGDMPPEVDDPGYC